MIQAEMKAAVSTSLTDMLASKMNRRTFGALALGAVAATLGGAENAEAKKKQDLPAIEFGDGVLTGDQEALLAGDKFTAKAFTIIQGDISLDIDGDGKPDRLFDLDNPKTGLTTYVVDGGQKGKAPFGASMNTYDGPISLEDATQAVDRQLEFGCGRDEGCGYVKFVVVDGDQARSTEIKKGEDIAEALQQLFGSTGKVAEDTSTSTPEPTEEAIGSEVVSKSNITIAQGTEMSVPAGFLCPGDSLADGVKYFDDNGATGLVLKTTDEVVLLNAFGPVTCIEDTQANMEMLKTQQETSGCGLPQGCDTVVFVAVPGGQQVTV
ncbi:MAG: hypothetical protein HYV40_01805 [Candidatus Levybacteria bacterium]|nr:hypothetical protein [Candidatus Levybacteria bacterium]